MNGVRKKLLSTAIKTYLIFMTYTILAIFSLAGAFLNDLDEYNQIKIGRENLEDCGIVVHVFPVHLRPESAHVRVAIPKGSLFYDGGDLKMTGVSSRNFYFRSFFSKTGDDGKDLYLSLTMKKELLKGVVISFDVAFKEEEISVLLNLGDILEARNFSYSE